MQIEGKVKILHYIFQDDFGGGPKNAWSISRQFSGVAAEQHFVFKKHGKLTDLAREDPSTQLHSIPQIPDALFFLDALWLAYYLWKIQPDVIFTHGQRGGVVASLASFLSPKIHRVYVAHFIGLYESTNLLALIRNYLAEKLTYHRQKWIVCVSEGNIRFLTNFGLIQDRYRVRLIPNAVMPVEKNPEPISCKKGNTQYLFMGRLAPQKRVDWLLHAWNHAISLGMSNAELSILGAGPLQKDLIALSASLGLDTTVQFLGHVKQPELMLESCDVVVFPSQYENHANVPLEALSAGKPIIAMDADGVRETFRDGVEGFIVPLGDWKAFGEKIFQLHSDVSLRHKMGGNGIERSKCYNTEVNGNAYRAMLQEILNGSPV